MIAYKKPVLSGFFAMQLKYVNKVSFNSAVLKTNSTQNYNSKGINSCNTKNQVCDFTKCTLENYQSLYTLSFNARKPRLLLRKTRLMSAVENGDIDEFNRLLKIKSANINQQDINGETLLMKASCAGYTDIVNKLLNHKEINVNQQDKLGMTALMYAARFGRTDTVRALLQHKGISINQQDIYGETALIYAVVFRHIDVVKVLLKHKHINVNLKNEDGRTALKDAGRHKQLVNLLSEYVAK